MDDVGRWTLLLLSMLAVSTISLGVNLLEHVNDGPLGVEAQLASRTLVYAQSLFLFFTFVTHPAIIAALKRSVRGCLGCFETDLSSVADEVSSGIITARRAAAGAAALSAATPGAPPPSPHAGARAPLGASPAPLALGLGRRAHSFQQLYSMADEQISVDGAVSTRYGAGADGAQRASSMSSATAEHLRWRRQQAPARSGDAWLFG